MVLPSEIYTRVNIRDGTDHGEWSAFAKKSICLVFL